MLLAMACGIMATDYATLGFGLHPGAAVAATFVLGISTGVLAAAREV